MVLCTMYWLLLTVQGSGNVMIHVGNFQQLRVQGVGLSRSAKNAGGAGFCFREKRKL